MKIPSVRCAVRRPGIEPGSQEWESCMIPLHQRRFLIMLDYKFKFKMFNMWDIGGFESKKELTLQRGVLDNLWQFWDIDFMFCPSSEYDIEVDSKRFFLGCVIPPPTQFPQPRKSLFDVKQIITWWWSATPNLNFPPRSRASSLDSCSLFWLEMGNKHCISDFDH